MTTPPGITTAQVATSQLRPGDAVAIPGTGTFSVARLLTALPAGQVAVALAWNKLAILAHPDDTWDAAVLTDALPRLVRRRTCPACGGTGRAPDALAGDRPRHPGSVR
jgi:hypothetical protein